MINFIELFNMVSQVSRPAHAKEAPATSMEDDETKEWHPTSVQEVFDYLIKRKTQEPESIEAAKEAIK